MQLVNQLHTHRDSQHGAHIGLLPPAEFKQFSLTRLNLLLLLFHTTGF